MSEVPVSEVKCGVYPLRNLRSFCGSQEEVNAKVMFSRIGGVFGLPDGPGWAGGWIIVGLRGPDRLRGQRLEHWSCFRAQERVCAAEPATLDGRFSNDPVWVDSLADALNVTVQLAPALGINHVDRAGR